MWREFLKLDHTNIWAPVGDVPTKTSIPDGLRNGKFTAIDLSELHGGKRIWPKLQTTLFQASLMLLHGDHKSLLTMTHMFH